MLSLSLLFFVSASWSAPADDPAGRARALVVHMTLDEKIALTHGTGWGQNTTGYVGRVAGIPRLKIPDLLQNDGPCGYHCGGLAQCPGGSTTAFPSALNVAATWSPLAAAQWGAAMGKEFRAKGANVQLGPGLCLARVPTGGRNFEYISGEDPVLGAKMAYASVAAIQQEGVIATIKHYVLNNQEWHRNTVSVTVDERTFMELYFPPYQGAIDAKVGAVMCSYNLVNGTHACGSNATLNRFLKEVGGFDGLVMTDWNAAHEPSDIVHGLDQEMPGSGSLNNATEKMLLKNGNLTMARLDDAATRVLTALYRVGAMDRPFPDPAANLTANVTTDVSAKAARIVARESAVLLKNDGVLPLKTGTNVLMAGSAEPTVGGWGSGSVAPSWSETIDNTLGARMPKPSSRGPPRLSNSDIEDPKTLAAIKAADVIVIVLETASGEGADRQNASFDAGCPHNWCPRRQNELVENITKVPGAGAKTVVIGMTTGTVLMPWHSEVAAIVLNWMPGQYYAAPLTDLLYGDATFSGKLPVTIPNIENEYNWTESQYPGISANSTGQPCPPHARDCTPPVVTYSEGLFVGYRWYDEHDVAPAYPFGHGMSYTTFGYSGLSAVADPTTGGATVSATITNSGAKYAGMEVAQLYVAFPGDDPFVPPRLLKGFNKTALLKPGESQPVEIALTPQDLSYWLGGAWVKQTGEFKVMLGSSSRDLRLNGTIAISA